MNTSRELLDMVATEAVEKYQRAEAVASSAFVRLSAVTLTEAEAEVFFNMLGMNAAEPSDVDYKEQAALHEKFTKARKPNIKFTFIEEDEA